MLGPVRPGGSAAVAAAGAHDVGAERPDDRFVRQVIGVHFGLVIAADRIAVDEQIADAMAADVAQRDGLECLSFAILHGFSDDRPSRREAAEGVLIGSK
jgi:hypothetical protein